MKKSAFGLMISAAAILSACAQYETIPQKSGQQVVNYYPKYEHKEFTLFDIGRTISHNEVDLFDPAAPTFMIPPDKPEFVSPLSSFPVHPFMLIRDEDVTVYSMFSNDTPRPTEELSAPPLPLNVDDSQLPP